MLIPFRTDKQVVSGILTLQPTSQPKTKAAGLYRHQVAILLFGLPSILLGTLAVSYNKWLGGARHFSTWHGVSLFDCHSKPITYRYDPDTRHCLYNMACRTGWLWCRECVV
jgi:hypothetical protein